MPRYLSIFHYLASEIMFRRPFVSLKKQYGEQGLTMWFSRRFYPPRGELQLERLVLGSVLLIAHVRAFDFQCTCARRTPEGMWLPPGTMHDFRYERLLPPSFRAGCILWLLAMWQSLSDEFVASGHPDYLPTVSRCKGTFVMSNRARLRHFTKLISPIYLTPR